MHCPIQVHVEDVKGVLCKLLAVASLFESVAQRAPSLSLNPARVVDDGGLQTQLVECMSHFFGKQLTAVNLTILVRIHLPVRYAYISRLNGSVLV